MDGEPDGWVIQHHRVGDTLTFGPFDDLDEAMAWASEHIEEGLRPVYLPCWRTLNWDRGARR